MAGVQDLIKWVLLAPFYIVSFFLRILRNPLTFFSYEVRPSPPCVLQNPDLGTHGYVRVGTSRIRLHYVTSGDTDKPLMVCLHGFPESWYSWRHQLKAFRKDYRVVAVDLQGFGDSDKPPAITDYTIEKMAGDIVDLIEALGYSSCILVAHDGGGFMAGQIAMDRPDLVDKLIIMNGPVTWSIVERYSNSRPAQVLKFWYGRFFQLPYLPEIYLGFNNLKRMDAIFRGKRIGCRNEKAITDEDLEAYKYSLSQPGALSGFVNFYRANFKDGIPFHSLIWNIAKVWWTGRRPAVEPITAIRCPSLLIWGDQDGVLDMGLAKAAEESIQGMKLKVVEGAGHFVQQDFPEVVNRLMAEFLKEP